MARKPAKREKRDDLDITLHPGRSLLAPGVLDDVHRVLRDVLPEWSRRLRVRLDERSREWVDVQPRRGALERAVRKIIAPGDTYHELEEALGDELGPALYDRDTGVVTITGAHTGVLVIVHVDEWVFSPTPDGNQHWGNFISLLARREMIDGVPIVRWAEQACRAFCRAIDIGHGHVTTDGEYYAKNKTGWRIVGLAPNRYLPGMYWMNVFGRPYVKLMGRQRLLSTPGAATSSAGGHVIVRFGEDPWAWKSQSYRAAVARALDHVGRRFFFDKAARKRDTVAPAFRFESDRIDRRRRSPPTTGGELIVDYTVGKVYLKPPKTSRSR